MEVLNVETGLLKLTVSINGLLITTRELIMKTQEVKVHENAADSFFFKNTKLDDLFWVISSGRKDIRSAETLNSKYGANIDINKIEEEIIEQVRSVVR